MKENMQFTIEGADYEYLKRFWQNHSKCSKGTACDQFSYTFVPTSLGMAITVECSCGKKLLLGDFMDGNNEYREV